MEVCWKIEYYIIPVNFKISREVIAIIHAS